MYRKTCLIILLVIGWLPLLAQQGSGPYLLLKKSGTSKQVVFREGDQIRYRMRGEDHFRKGLILGLRRDTVRFHYFEVPLSDFEVIDISSHNFQNFHYSHGGDKVIIAGVLFLAADFVSQKLIRDEEGELSPATYAISGGIIGAGFLMKLFHKRKFRPGGRYIIDIIDLRVR